MLAYSVSLAKHSGCSAHLQQVQGPIPANSCRSAAGGMTLGPEDAIQAAAEMQLPGMLLQTIGIAGSPPLS